MKTKTTKLAGYRIQIRLPIEIGWFGARCDAAWFSEWEGKTCVVAQVWMGLVKSPYLLHLTIDQALRADIIERTEDSKS